MVDRSEKATPGAGREDSFRFYVPAGQAHDDPACMPVRRRTRPAANTSTDTPADKIKKPEHIAAEIIKESPAINAAIYHVVRQLDGLNRSDRKAVAALQTSLKEMNFDPGKIDGGWGNNTQRAVNSFLQQKAEDVTVARQVLQKAKEVVITQREERIDGAVARLGDLSVAERKTLETDLKSKGYKTGKVDGLLDPTSFRAIRQETTPAQRNTHADAALKTAIEKSVDNLSPQEQERFAIQLNAVGLPVRPKGAETLHDLEQARETLLATRLSKPDALNSQQVGALKHNLKSLGLYDGKIDDRADTSLAKAVSQFAAERDGLGLSSPSRAADINSHHAAAIEYVASVEAPPQGRVFLFPIQAEDVRISSAMGMRMHPLLNTRKMHKGTDFSPKYAQPLLDGEWYKTFGLNGNFRHAAVHDAIITDVQHSSGTLKMHPIVNGQMIRNEEIIFRHMERIDVEKGDTVTMGQTVGIVGERGGSTAPHAHVEHWVNGAPQKFQFAYEVDGVAKVLDANRNVDTRFKYSRSVSAMETLTGRNIARYVPDGHELEYGLDRMLNHLDRAISQIGKNLGNLVGENSERSSDAPSSRKNLGKLPSPETPPKTGASEVAGKQGQAAARK